jgi:hypothetical protein
MVYGPALPPGGLKLRRFDVARAPDAEEDGLVAKVGHDFKRSGQRMPWT